jgi:hypothetical protein
MNVSIDEFIVRAAQWSPGFPERIRGATSQEIQVLTELVGFPLPEVHAQFLARMGHGDGGAHLAMEGSMDITDVINQYIFEKEERERLETSEWDSPSDCILLEADRVLMDIALKVAPGREPRVVFSKIRAEYLCAESLVGYLGRRAFDAFRCMSLRYRLAYGSSYLSVGERYVVGDARRILLGLGFVEEWFSDSVSFCGERADVVVIATQFENSGLSVLVSSQDFKRAEEVGTALSKEININYVQCL